MNVRMWLHKSTQNNVNKLLDFGYLSIGPSELAIWHAENMARVKCPHL